MRDNRPAFSVNRLPNMRLKKNDVYEDPVSRPWYIKSAFRRRMSNDERIRNLIEEKRFMEHLIKHQRIMIDTTESTTIEFKELNFSPTPTTDEFSSSIVSERLTYNPEWASWLNPMFLAISICLGMLCLLIFMVKRVFRTKSPLGSQEVSPPSILVYPAQNGQAPQFLTKEISFSLPSPRSSSLNELNVGSGTEPEPEDTLAPIRPQQRSNSFTASSELGVIDPALYQENFLDDDLIWPEGHVGRLWFSLRYESSSEKLLVTLVKAKNLPSRTIASINTCDPFVRLQLMPDERRTLQSKQKKKTCNPFFEETFVFQISAKGIQELILKMTVVDGGRPKARQTLGHVIFPLAALPEEETANGEAHVYKLDLEKDPQEPTSDLGEMLVSLLYNENLNRLTVTVIEGRRLKVKGERRQVYVRVTMNQQYRAVKSKRSRWTPASVEGEAAISECFHFRLPATGLPLACITLHVLQAGAKCSRDKVIGKFVLGSFMFARGKALEHWNAALANPMEQVQQWHALSI